MNLSSIIDSVAVRRKINVEEYYKMAEVGILKPTDRIELINGEILEMSPIGSKHASTVKRLSHLLNGIFGNKAIIGIQDPIRIDGLTEPEPDVSILKWKEDYYADKHPEPDDVLAIIEVANSSVIVDKEIKLPLYALHKIDPYWIIDIEKNQLLVYSSPEKDFYKAQEIFTPQSQVSLLGQSLEVSDFIIE